jgi:hypothetical protein
MIYNFFGAPRALGPIAAQFSVPFKSALLTTLTPTIYARLYPTSKQRPSGASFIIFYHVCKMPGLPLIFWSDFLTNSSRKYALSFSRITSERSHLSPYNRRFSLAARTAFLVTPVWRKCGGRKSTCFGSMPCFLPTPTTFREAAWNVRRCGLLQCLAEYDTCSLVMYSIADSGASVRYQFKFTVTK